MSALELQTPDEVHAANAALHRRALQSVCTEAFRSLSLG